MLNNLTRVKQFSIGAVFVIMGAIELAAIYGMHFFSPPPSFEADLYPISGNLEKRISISKPGRGDVYAYVRLYTPTGISDGRIRYFNATLSDDTLRHEILSLEPGTQITIWLTKNDVFGYKKNDIWQLQHGGKTLLSIEQSLATQKESESLLFNFITIEIVIGIILSIWGLRIYFN